MRIEHSTSCLLCGLPGEVAYASLRDTVHEVAGEWGFLRCRTCGLLWLNPRPVEGEWAAYSGYSTHRRAKRGILSKPGLCPDEPNKVRSQLYQLARYIPVLSEIFQWQTLGLDRSVPSRTVLDVGCGSGGLLEALRNHGWTVFGIEPDPVAASVAQAKLGDCIYDTTLTAKGFPENTFDVITMNHVIEHLHRPLDILAECRRILKGTGRLIIVTPNAQSLGHKLLKESWRGLEVPRHINIFTVKSLRSLLTASGLRMKQVTTLSRSACWIWTVSTLASRRELHTKQDPTQLQKALALAAGVLFHICEYNLKMLHPCGEEIVAIVTK